jgi:membrane protein
MRKLYVSAWTILKKTVSNFFDNDSFTYAASIAFSTIFSLPAILIIALSIGATFYEKNIVQQELINQVAVLVGRQSAIEIENILLNASIQADSTLAQIIGIATLLFSATTVFVSLQSSLNKIWQVKSKPQSGILKFFLDRLLSFAMVLSLGFVLLVSLLIDTVLVIFQGFISRILEGITLYILTGVNIIVALSFITIIFALLFRVLPDAKIKWKDVWVGAMITTLLFTIGKYLIGFYLGASTLNTAYGAAGSLVIILIWVYYSTMIFLFGAELTFVYAQSKGHKAIPSDNAVKVKEIEIKKKENEKSS